MAILLLIVGLFSFIMLIVTHEFGHFIMARRNGVEVEEFGIFFPPRLFKYKTKAGWLFTINLLPLGGFVKLKGEHDSDTKKGTYGAASLLAKSKIMTAGVIVNLFTAFLLLTILAVIGLPKIIPNQFTVKSDTHENTVHNNADSLVNTVVKGSAADKAGIKKGDKVLAIGTNGHPQRIANPEDLPDLTKSLAGKQVSVQVQRSNHKLTLVAQLPTPKQLQERGQQGYLGIGTTPEAASVTLRRSTWSAPVVAVGLSAQLTGLTFQGIGHALGGLGSLVAGTATGNKTARQHGQTEASQVSGPVGIFILLKEGSAVGYQFMLFIIALISLTLAIMNILPIPALDGGRFWITLFTRAIHRPLSPKREETINAAGFLILMLLIVAITSVDIQRIIHGTL